MLVLVPNRSLLVLFVPVEGPRSLLKLLLGLERLLLLVLLFLSNGVFLHSFLQVFRLVSALNSLLIAGLLLFLLLPPPLDLAIDVLLGLHEVPQIDVLLVFQLLILPSLVLNEFLVLHVVTELVGHPYEVAGVQPGHHLTIPRQASQTLGGNVEVIEPVVFLLDHGH